MNENELKLIKDAFKSIDQLMSLCLRMPEITPEILRSIGLAYEKSFYLWRTLNGSTVTYKDEVAGTFSDVRSGALHVNKNPYSVYSCRLFPDNKETYRAEINASRHSLHGPGYKDGYEENFSDYKECGKISEEFKKAYAECTPLGLQSILKIMKLGDDRLEFFAAFSDLYSYDYEVI